MSPVDQTREEGGVQMGQTRHSQIGKWESKKGAAVDEGIWPMKDSKGVPDME